MNIQASRAAPRRKGENQRKNDRTNASLPSHLLPRRLDLLPSSHSTTSQPFRMEREPTHCMMSLLLPVVHLERRHRRHRRRLKNRRAESLMRRSCSSSCRARRSSERRRCYRRWDRVDGGNSRRGGSGDEGRDPESWTLWSRGRRRRDERRKDGPGL